MNIGIEDYVASKHKRRTTKLNILSKESTRNLPASWLYPRVGMKIKTQITRGLKALSKGQLEFLSSFGSEASYHNIYIDSSITLGPRQKGY